MPQWAPWIHEKELMTFKLYEDESLSITMRKWWVYRILYPSPPSTIQFQSMIYFSSARIKAESTMLQQQHADKYRSRTHGFSFIFSNEFPLIFQPSNDSFLSERKFSLNFYYMNSMRSRISLSLQWNFNGLRQKKDKWKNSEEEENYDKFIPIKSESFKNL